MQQEPSESDSAGNVGGVSYLQLAWRLRGWVYTLSDLIPSENESFEMKSDREDEKSDGSGIEYRISPLRWNPFCRQYLAPVICRNNSCSFAAIHFSDPSAPLTLKGGYAKPETAKKSSQVVGLNCRNSKKTRCLGYDFQKSGALKCKYILSITHDHGVLDFRG